MPVCLKVVAWSVAIASAAMITPALSQVQERSPPATVHHAAKAKVRSASPFAEASQGSMHMDDWFSLGPEKEAEIEKEAPGVKIKVHDPQEDDIVVYGQRQKRDFEGATPAPNLTSPQALEAAQPAFVPAMGDSCTYKYGCFDSGQTPLRSSLFGD
jgi:hypothetical protein